MRLGNKTTNPGELRTPIELQNRVVTQSAGGFSQLVWTTFANVKCKWVNVHGNEAIRLNAEVSRAKAKILLRFRPDVDTTCAVLRDGRQWEITSVDNIRERGEYMELIVEEMEVG